MKLERKRWHFGSKGGQVEATGLLNLRPPISDACMGYVITQMGFLKLPRLAGVEERFPAEFTELYGRPLNSYFFSLEGLKIIFKLSMGMCRGNSIARFLFFVKLGYSRPLNITGLHCVGPLIRRSFQKRQSAFCIPGFPIRGFHLPWMESSIFDAQLGICGRRGPTDALFYTILRKGLELLRISVSAVWDVWERMAHEDRGTTVAKFWGRPVIGRFSTAQSIGAPSSRVVQGSTVQHVVSVNFRTHRDLRQAPKYTLCFLFTKSMVTYEWSI